MQGANRMHPNPRDPLFPLPPCYVLQDIALGFSQTHFMTEAQMSFVSLAKVGRDIVYTKAVLLGLKFLKIIVLSSEDNLMALVEVVFIFQIIFFLYRHWILKNIVPNLPKLWNFRSSHLPQINMENS